LRSLDHVLLTNRRRSRRENTQDHLRNQLQKLAAGCAASLSILVAIFILAGGLLYASIANDLPSIEKLPILLNAENGLLLQPSQVYDKSGEYLLFSLQQPGIPRRYLQIQPGLTEFLSPQLTQTTIALMEPDFWKSPGFHWRKILDPQPQTIAEKLVNDLLLENEPISIKRNLRMRLLAGQVVAEYGRAQVLEWYLNSAYFGNLAYGADTAAQLYLGKPAGDLTFQEAALLTTIAEAPTLNPFDAPTAAREREENALKTLFVQGFISVDEYATAQESPLVFINRPSWPNQIAKTFTQTVIRELEDRLGRHTVGRGGLAIITTLDYDLQTQMNCSLVTQLARITSNEDPVYENCDAARLLPALPSNLEPYPENVSASSILMDNKSGKILAMVGDTSLTSGELEYLTRHQPGSLLTPFVALAGFARGLNPADLVWDIPGTLPEPVSDYFDSNTTYHGPQRLRTAITNDYLAPITKILLQIGPQNVWRISESVGLHSLIDSNLPDQLLFKGGETDLLSLAQAFSTFSESGSQTGYPSNDDSGALSPILIQSVSFHDGQTLFSTDQTESKSVINPQLAYLVHHILSDETARWPSLGYPNPFEIGRPVGAKVGRIATGNEIWAVGYTRQLLNITWFGTTDSTQENSRIDPRIVTGLWHAIIQYASRGMAVEDWSIPPGITIVEVCSPSGKIPTLDCPTTVQEVFLNGNEPTEYDDLYKTFQINRETGRLATVFTPPELIQENTYMIIPPQAQDWAQANNIPVPPGDYDIIQAPAINANVQITNPALFAYVRGTVTIGGTAAGPEFKSYNIQVGKGLNPQAWQQIGDTHTISVSNGLLGRWETEEDGLYALRLVVTRNNQEIENHTIQITVDNTPPEAQVRYPSPNQRFEKRADQQIIFQAQVEDAIGIEKVEWYVDQVLVGTFAQAPYSFSWTPTPGSHQVLLKVRDLAGNETSAIPIPFEVQ